MSVLGARIRPDDSVELEVDDEIFLATLRGDQVERLGENVYGADGITFDFNTEKANWDDEGRPIEMTIGPLQVDELKSWFEKYADRANMETVKPKLEEKLNPDVAKKIAEYGGKKKRKTRKLRKLRKLRKTKRKTIKGTRGKNASYCK
jgi:hypothetical protein